MAIKPESQEQIKLFDWIRLHPKISKAAFYIPNDGKRSPQMGWLMKKMGMRPGVSDVFLAIANNESHGMFLELKAKDSRGIYRKPTAFQVKFQKDMLENGYHCVVANGADDAIEAIKNYVSTI